MEEKIIIGMTGPFGSGCTYVAKEILHELGYEYISLSDLLRECCKGEDKTRTELQDLGNDLRAQNGNGYLATKAIEIIEASNSNKFVIDSIRNTHEVETFKLKYSNFFLFAVWASYATRWERIKEKYKKMKPSFWKTISVIRTKRVRAGSKSLYVIRWQMLLF